MTDTFQGSCLCGAVKYQLSSRPKALSHCHCSQCRKSHGAAFASYGSVLRSDLRIVQGAGSLQSYRSSETVRRQFCGQCGSSLFWSRDQGEYADWISIALGTLDTPFTADKQKHIQVAFKASWYEIQDNWPQEP
ncbi:GFA family protein [Pseudomonas chlororaphis]|uniref:GFA family protein n=1 Tax=Pseudomonas chlororaphis TaxID=587753 RepID=UPI000E0A1C93|nr:GFA family protein [Pseudomonas chlororaphis]AZD15481.1 Gfa-like protein [Pseudomonas chlororaphis]WDH49894.1 GFA family protein [Pseudomonas chlororaphis]WDH61743.1 GFA family protein [Pseudomonas chlororaphis]WQE21000.1 GFA family protein [Pseudomonas chlororaphis]